MDDSLRACRVRAAIAIGVLWCMTGFIPACSTPYMGTTAASFLSRVEDSRDPNIRYVAYSKLASPNCYDDEKQKLEAIRVLIKKLESGREPIATQAIICRTLGELRKPEARPALLRMLNAPEVVDDPKGLVRAETCRALGKVGSVEDATVLARIMTVDNLGDCKIAAIEGLGELKANDQRINLLLVQGMEHDDPAIRLASLRALRKITRKDLGVEPAPWRDYVEKETIRQAATEDKKQEPARETAKKSKNPKPETTERR
jgi:HEAT repeat protein